MTWQRLHKHTAYSWTVTQGQMVLHVHAFPSFFFFFFPKMPWFDIPCMSKNGNCWDSHSWLLFPFWFRCFRSPCCFWPWCAHGVWRSASVTLMARWHSPVATWCQYIHPSLPPPAALHSHSPHLVPPTDLVGSFQVTCAAAFRSLFIFPSLFLCIILLLFTPSVSPVLTACSPWTTCLKVMLQELTLTFSYLQHQIF